MAGDEASMCHWLRADNTDLGGVPLLLMVDDDQLEQVLSYVESLAKVASKTLSRT